MKFLIRRTDTSNSIIDYVSLGDTDDRPQRKNIVMNKVLVLDNLINQTRDRHLSAFIRDKIFRELTTLADLESDGYSLRAYLHNHNGKPMQGSEHIFKYQLTDGDRILYTLGKYLPYVPEDDADSLVLISHAKHDSQGEEAKTFSFTKDQKYAYLSELVRDLKDVGLESEGFNDEDLIALAELLSAPDYSRWHTLYVVRDEQYDSLTPEQMEISLVSEQAEVLNDFFEKPAPTIVLGGAGTGKTLVAIHILSDFHKSNPDKLAMYFTQSFELREKSKKVFETLVHDDYGLYVEFHDIIEYCIDYLNLSRKSYVNADRFLSFINSRKDLLSLCEKESISPIDVWTEIRGTIKGAMSLDWTHHKEYLQQGGIYGNIEKYVRSGLLVRSPKNQKHFKLANVLPCDDLELQKDGIFQRIITYFSSFDPDKRTLEMEEYYSLPDENATLNRDKREAVWTICKAYDDNLKKNHLFDDNDLVREMFRYGKSNELPSTDLLVVDEIQDYTELQIFLLYSIAIDKTRIALVGDNHQNVNPTYFSVSRLESLFYQVSGEQALRVNHLHVNHRCPQAIIDRTNELSNVRRRRIAKMSNDLEQPETSRKEYQSIVARVQFSEDNLKALIEECVKYPGVVILVPDEETRNYAIRCVGEAFYGKQRIRCIFTVPEIKGMEYSYVIAFDLIGKYCPVWNEMLSTDIAKRQTKYRYYFNLLYVAMSRTQFHLCFIDKETTESVEKILKPHEYGSVNTDELRFTDLIQSDEGWISYAKSCEENGQFENALGAYLNGHAPEKDIFRCNMKVSYRDQEYETAMKYCILSDSGEYGERILKELSDGEIKEIGSLYVALFNGSHKITRSGPAIHIQAISNDDHELNVVKEVLLFHYSKTTGKIIKNLQSIAEAPNE